MGTHPIFESDFDCLTEIMRFSLGRKLIRISARCESSAPRVPSYYDKFAKPEPPAPISAEESSNICLKANKAIEKSEQGYAIIYVDDQFRVTDNDLIEASGDWPVKLGQQIYFEKILLAGSKDFTLLGRPTIPGNLVTVSATCVEKRNNDEAKVRFLNPRAPRKPALSFKREIKTIFRINEVKFSANLN